MIFARNLGQIFPFIVFLFLAGCAGSLGSNGYELDVARCHASGGEVLINRNSETSKCIY